MVQTTISYIKVLYELKMELSVVHEAEEILREAPQIQEVLDPGRFKTLSRWPRITERQSCFRRFFRDMRSIVERLRRS